MTQLLQGKPAPPLTELQSKLKKRGFMSFAFDGQHKFVRYLRASQLQYADDTGTDSA
jgi:hypothetical protein